MGAITDTAADAFRDYATDGIPASGAHEPAKSEIRTLFAQIEQTMGTLALGGVDVTKDTRANLNADLAHAADSVGLVYADGTDANNDLYIKVGGSGSGSWTLTTILHDVLEGAAAEHVQAAEDAAALAEAWAEGTEPGGVGTKSAKEYSEDAAAEAAAITGLVEVVAGDDLFAFADDDGNVAAVLTGDGRLLAVDGRDVIAESRAGAFAGLMAAARTAATDAEEATLLLDAGRYGDPVMWDRMIWAEKDSANVNAVRMPFHAVLDPDAATEFHVFACEKRGDETTNNGGEAGFRASWRVGTIDWGARTVTMGAVSVLKEPSTWASHVGYEGTFAGGLITQGDHAGEVEVAWFSIVPDTAGFDTPGSEAYLRYATSADDYAAQSVLIAGNDIYTQFPAASASVTQQGVAPTPSGWAQIPAGLANEGRRVFALWVISGDEGLMTTIRAAKDDLFSDAFVYGNLVDLTAVGFGGINEVSVLHDGTRFHVYARNDNEDAGAEHPLADMGPVHVDSVDGATSWSAPTHLTAAPIGNVQMPTAYLPEYGLTVIGGSTAPAASLRTSFSYFIGLDAEEFLIEVPNPVEAAAIGYGNFQWVRNPAGEWGLSHVYEVGSPGEWNRLSGIRWRWMNLAWLLANGQRVGG